MTISHRRFTENQASAPKSGGPGSDSTHRIDSHRRVIRMSRNPRSPVLDSIESEIEMMADDSNPMDDDAVCKRYVVLVAPGEQLPPPLIELLTDRSDDSVPTNVFQANHPLIAISLISRLERERRLRRKWELDEQTVLVVANSDSWNDLSSLFNATRQHMPAVPIWTVIKTHALQIYAGEPDDQGRFEDGDHEEDPREKVPHEENPVAEVEDSGETDRTTLNRDEYQELLEALDFEEEPEDGPENEFENDEPEPEQS